MRRARRKAVVAGAGVAGLGAALLLARRGWEVEVLEASSGPGGLIRPFHFRGVPCDLGSHRLHPDALDEPLVREMAPAIALGTRTRRGRIVLNRRHIPYPLTLGGMLRGLRPGTAARFARDYARQAGRIARWERDRVAVAADAHDAGFEAFVVGRVGRAPYDEFFRPYAEKTWGLPPARLSQTVAKKRFSTSRPGRQLASAILRPARGRPRFSYPAIGMGGVVRWLEARAAASGVTFHYGRRVAGDCADLDATAVLMSGHLRHLCPEAGLTHRGLYLVFLALPAGAISDVETWYLPESRYFFGRVSEPRNYSAALSREGERVLCLEIPEGRWGPDRDFRGRTGELMAQLEDAGIVDGKSAPLEAAQLYLPSVYPLYERGWLPRWREALATVGSRGRVFPFGRQGLFLHSNIDHSLRIARDLAGALERGADGADWSREATAYQGLRVRD